MHRILVVDDEEAIRKNLERLLTLEGYEVASAPNGQHGFVLAKSMLPDIVISDVNMPVMDGFAMLDAIRAHPEIERTVVIMLTAAEDRSHVRRGMGLGADDYITKPFKREELLDSIRAQLQKIKRVDRYKNQAVSTAIAQSEDRTRADFGDRYGTPADITYPNHLTKKVTKPSAYEPQSSGSYTLAELSITYPNANNKAKVDTPAPSSPTSPRPVHRLPDLIPDHMPEYRPGAAPERQHSSFGESGFAPSGFSNFGLDDEDEHNAIPAGPSLQATVMFADIRNFTSMAERLTAAELAGLLGRYFELACRPVVAYGGTHLKMLGDGLLALFEDESHDSGSGNMTGTTEITHASRAMSAAMGLSLAAIEFRHWVSHTYGARGLPEFSVGIGLHSGEVTLGQLGSHEAREITPLGDTVNIASRLQAAGKTLGWSVVASAQTTDLAGDGVEPGRHKIIRIRGRDQAVSACEVLNYRASVDFQLGVDGTEQAFQTAAIGTAAKENSQNTARAAKSALKQSLWSLQSGAFTSQPQRFKGYHIIRKLGEGGMSDVFLAYSAAKKSEVVLKVLRTSLQSDAEMLRRFIQEYALLTNIRHHHIAEIYDQGFTDEYAFIAMEHLSGGGFKTEIAKRPSHPRIVDLLRQIVSALGTIHSLGLVYRDLKPDNLMFRAAGELVLVDFGIVKNVREETDSLLRTHSGQIIGTPYYVSPEQASGKEVTHRSDFYSLGVILYELLTGLRPYRGDSLGELLAAHIHAPTPVLPAEHAKFQPFLSCMMSKVPEDRPADCTAVWRNLEMLDS